jgi:uncharacterized protein
MVNLNIFWLKRPWILPPNLIHKKSLAAYITGVFVDNPRIFCTATDSFDIVKSFHEQNISTMDSGSLTGMNGLIIGIAKLRGIKGTCLLGETSGYVIDAKASKSILEALLSIFHINMDCLVLRKEQKIRRC